MLFGVHDVDGVGDMYGELEIDVDVTGDLTAEERSMIREFPKRSPVYALVTLEHPNRPRVEFRSAA